MGLSFVVGVILIVVSYLTDVSAPNPEWRSPWLSNLLLNLGAAFVLFGLFFLLTERISARVAEAERDVGQSQTDLQQLRDDFRDVDGPVSANLPAIGKDRDRMHASLGDPAPLHPAPAPAVSLDEEVHAALSSERKSEDAMYARVASSPNYGLLKAALNQATKTGLISESGPRCQIPGTDVHVRFITSDQNQSQVVLQLETNVGDELAKLAWGEGSTAADLFAAIGKVLIKLELYPGDQLYFPSEVTKRLSELFLYASRYRQSATGESDIEKVIEILESGWVIMEEGIAPKSYRHYLIATNRLKETDWASHIRNKPWPEAPYVESALAIARGLNGVDPGDRVLREAKEQLRIAVEIQKRHEAKVSEYEKDLENQRDFPQHLQPGAVARTSSRLASEAQERRLAREVADAQAHLTQVELEQGIVSPDKTQD
jgi:hypothetical protein